jgi:hypothetical protein
VYVFRYVRKCVRHTPCLAAGFSLVMNKHESIGYMILPARLDEPRRGRIQGRIQAHP